MLSVSRDLSCPARALTKNSKQNVGLLAQAVYLLGSGGGGRGGGGSSVAAAAAALAAAASFVMDLVIRPFRRP